jgi:hypothetical protein
MENTKTSEKPEISILLPAIRVNEWVRVYDSLSQATKRNFELIIVGPFALPENLQKVTNIKYCKDFGCPTRASSIASLMAEGELISWFTDDGTYNAGSLDLVIDELREMGEDEKNIVTSKYGEGNHNNPAHASDEYWTLNYHPAISSPFAPDHWITFNTAIMYRSYYEKLGGVDCEFEHVAIADADLAYRAYQDGANVKMVNVKTYHCAHGQPDHQPIAECHVMNDEPLIHSKYREPNWRDNVKISIDINNWKKASSVWERRFKRL